MTDMISSLRFLVGVALVASTAFVAGCADSNKVTRTTTTEQSTTRMPMAPTTSTTTTTSTQQSRP